MSEETHPGEVQTSVGTPDYMGNAERHLIPHSHTAVFI